MNTRRARERAIHVLLFLSAFLTVGITFGIILTLLTDTITFFRSVSPLEFFTGTNWSPTIRPFSYGVLPLVAGTLMITIGAGMIAIPVGLLSAIYLSEYASERMRSILKPLL